jgi:hypothetical protein
VSISIVVLGIFVVWLSEEIPQRNIIENLYQFRQPLTFIFNGIDFTVSKRELYSDFNACITEVLINDEIVLQAYRLETLWIKHRYIRYSTDRSAMEVQEILKQARKVYYKNLSKECEEAWQYQSYFKEGK